MQGEESHQYQTADSCRMANGAEPTVVSMQRSSFGKSSRGVGSPDPPLTPPDMRARIRRFVRLI